MIGQLMRKRKGETGLGREDGEIKGERDPETETEH